MMGSLVCALAPNMFVLILGRVLHGLGGGGLTSTGMVVLGDIAAPKDRGKYYGYFSATYTTAGACGPVLGGCDRRISALVGDLLDEHPTRVAGAGADATLLRKLPRHDRPHRLDFLGALLIMTASSPSCWRSAWAACSYPWTSPPILALFAVALVVGIGFIVRLRTAPEPLIPLSILSDREARLSVIVNAFGWGPIVGLHIFLPIYLQNIVGMAPALAGITVLMLAVTLNVSAGVNGWLLPRRERYKTIPILGLLLAIVAVLALAWRADRVSLWEFEALLFLIGLGFGCMPPLSATVLQNNVSIHTFGSAVATMQFSRNLYATIIVAVFGVLVLAGAESIAGTVTQYSVEGFRRVFMAVAASFAIALIAVVMLEEKPLQTTHV